ncbi:MAG TPA: sigma-54 dependent transcriptional regulator [Candidatus Binatia bacterium]|nr:sigma-54 dependent transcriptional regulator [Candidatus Binatia bacterium]
MPDALLIDDDATQLSGLAELVEHEGFTTRTAGTLAEARVLLEERTPDVVLSDLVLPDGSGIDLLKDIDPALRTDMVLITGHASVESAIEALRIGVTDYLTKPVDLPRLKTVLTNVTRRLEMKKEIGTLRGELRKLGRFGRLIGASSCMQLVYDLIGKVAPTEATVLLMGESGTGKEIASETVHELSQRRRGPFLAINCGAVSPNLIESELFGHERGSFTGAGQRHRGHFERASGGTLFLDEITEMPIELQVKLLRVLETGSVLRIGGDTPIQTDVRVIAATNRNTSQAVAEGKLREDLYYRLNVFPISLPPLRERGGDIPLLARYFLDLLNEAEQKQKRMSDDAVARLEHYEWPGNVRELRNVIHRAFIMADDEVGLDALPEEVRAPVVPLSIDADEPLKVGTSLTEVERRLILATLAHYDGDKKKTADVLGISLKTLDNRLNLYTRD